MNSLSRLSIEQKGGLARITFAHPPLNVFDFVMMDEVSSALERIQRQPEISVLVLSGGKRAFSAGVDVAVHTADKIRTMFQKFHSLILTLAGLQKVTIAEVHGACLGGGAELAMICDLCFTAETARWGFPEITLGCYPPVACAALAALVGQKRAADLIFTGRTFTGQEAADWGLAVSAHPEGEDGSAVVGRAIQDRLDHLLSLSPKALGYAKKAFYAWNAVHLEKGLAQAEKIYAEELIQTDDAKEGIRAWLEKRKPEWKGK